MDINKNDILKRANKSCVGSLMETLSIDFIDVGQDFIIAKMPCYFYNCVHSVTFNVILF